MIKIKHVKGKCVVDISKMSNALWYAIKHIDEMNEGVDTVITCLRAWRKTGLHPHGEAADLRANHVEPHQAVKMVEEYNDFFQSSKSLYNNIQVILHGEGSNIHFHVEYDNGITKRLPIPPKSEFMF